MEKKESPDDWFNIVAMTEKIADLEKKIEKLEAVRYLANLFSEPIDIMKINFDGNVELVIQHNDSRRLLDCIRQLQQALKDAEE
jgi:hypothetical protein